MPIVCLAKVSPLDPATGNRVDLYLSSADDSRVTGLNGLVWEPALTAAPTLSINLWQGDFQEPVDTGGASFGFNIGILKMTYANADTYMWAGAPVEIYAEEPGTAWPWAQRFKGRVAGFSRRNQVVTINSKIDTEPFEKNVLTATYAGTTGAEGSADLKGRLKPLVIGWAKNVEPVLIDATNSVYQFSAYGAIEAVSVLYERATDFGASVGDYATYAALVAATIPAGRWATCLAAGMVRLGAPAAGVITGDIRGHRVGGTTPRLTGAVISALATIAGVSAGDIEASTLTALDSAVAYPINIVLTEQSKFNDIAASLALACNWQSGITLQGKFFVLAVTLTGSEVLTLNAQGAALPQVTSSDEQDVSVPYYQTIFGAVRNWRVQSSDEIAFTAPLIPRGMYSASETYREGNIVTTDDGATWLYINTTAGSGNAPPALPTTSNAYWSNMTSAITGVPGAPGADGVTLYTWYAYADSADGAINFTIDAPGSRVYQGIAANKTTATESTTPSDYTWIPYIGPPAFGLAAANGGEVSGAKIVRRSGSAWAAQVYSTESFTGAAFVSFKLEPNGDGGYGGVMVGLNTDPTTASWESLDHAIYVEGGSTSGNLYNAESGSLISAGTWTSTDTFSVHYDGANVRYAKNGTVFRTIGASSGTRFFLDSAMSASGVCASITGWAAAGPVGPQGAAGANGTNGTDGANGAPAIGFVQDSSPGSGQFISQTWYRPTSKEWYRWTGGSWERILGDLSAQNLIADSAFLADLVVAEGKIANLSVDTIKIKGNAITAPFAASTSSPVFLPAPADSITDILSLSLTPTNINSAYLSLSSDAANTHASYSYIAQFQIVINGSLVFTSENMLLSPQGIAGNTGFWSHSGIFPVNVGSSNSIVLRVKTIGYYDNTSVRVTNRSIFALELKR